MPINQHTINQFFGKCFSPGEARAFIAAVGDASIRRTREPRGTGAQIHQPGGAHPPMDQRQSPHRLRSLRELGIYEFRHSREERTSARSIRGGDARIVEI